MRIDESLTNKFGQQIEVQGKSKRRLFLTVPKAIALEEAKVIAEDMKDQDVKDAVARGEIPEIVAIIAYLNSLK